MTVKISITGDVASGKSVLAGMLAARYEVERISAGNMRREMLQEDILQSNRDPAKNAWIDSFIDGRVFEKIHDAEAERRGYIVDARLGFQYAPESLKVKLLTHPTISAERVFRDKRETENYETLEKTLASITERQQIEKERWAESYGVDLDDPKNFDVIIDTSFVSLEHAAEIIEMVRQAKEDGRPFPQFWCHPAQIIPTQPTRSGFNNELVHNLIPEMQEGHFDHLASAASHLSQMRVLMTSARDLVLDDGHHRNVAAIVSGLPYLGCAMVQKDVTPNLSYMYDNYEAVYYFAGEHGVETIYGEPVGDAALNRFKFNLVERLMPKAPAPGDHQPQ